MDYCVYIGKSFFVVTERELYRHIFDGKITADAQIQKGPKGRPCRLRDTAEWRRFCQPDGGKDEATSACAKKEWVLLTKRPKSGGFQQKGPYSAQQIAFFMREGLCSAKDFIWKKGFTEWKRISLVPGFCAHPAHFIEDVLTQQTRKYRPGAEGRARMVRYSPSLTQGGEKPLFYNALCYRS